MKVFSSPEDRRRGLLGLLLVALVFVGVYVFLRRYAPFVFDPQALRAWIAQFGPLAPIVFILVQAVQVVVAPIPGQVLALISGYLFGAVAGTVYSLIGVLVGSAVAFSIAKRYGRSFVESVLHEDVIARFDGFVDRVGVPGLVAFVVIPGLPDDAICFLSGLTKLPLRAFMAAITVGRLPAYVLTVYAGGQLASGRFLWGTVLVAIVIALSVIGYYNQELIRKLVERLSPGLPV